MISTKPHDWSLCDHAYGICTHYELTEQETKDLIEHSEKMRLAHESFLAQLMDQK